MRRLSPFWQRLLGSFVFALATLVLVYGRTMLSGQFDLPMVLIGLLFGTFLAYRAWPAIDFARWRRWKNPGR